MADRVRDEGAPTAFDSVDPPRNFTLPVGERIRALTIGAPAYAVRKRKIEDTEDRWVRTLLDLHDALIAKGRASNEVGVALREKAATFDYARQNALVATHNRWYPVEANLRIEPRTGEYLIYGRRWEPEPEYTAERIVERALAILAER